MSLSSSAEKANEREWILQGQLLTNDLVVVLPIHLLVVLFQDIREACLRYILGRLTLLPITVTYALSNTQRHR